MVIVTQTNPSMSDGMLGTFLARSVAAIEG
jgi:hypothetical protein